jgi:hypothetical protein
MAATMEEAPVKSEPVAAPAIKKEPSGDANGGVIVKKENGEAVAPAAKGLPQLNGAVFFRRLKTLYKSWADHKRGATWGDADSFCVLAGKPQPDESGYRKSAVLQIFLLGFLEFPETLMVFTPKTLYVLTAGKKCTFVFFWECMYCMVGTKTGG